MKPYKAILIFLTLFVFTGICDAQKPIANTVNFKYIKPPIAFLPEGIKAYAVEVKKAVVLGSQIPIISLQPTGKTSGAKQAIYGCKDMEAVYSDYLTFSNLQQVKNNPDITVELSFSFPRFTRGETKQIKGSDGKVSSYGYEFSYSFSSHLTIRGRTNNVLFQKELRSTSQQGSAIFWESSRKISCGSRQAEYLIIADREFQKYFLQAKELLADMDFQSLSIETSIITAKANKKLNYDDLTKAYSIVSTVLREQNSNTPTPYVLISPSLVSQLDEAITIWEKAIQEADLGNKKARINKFNVYGIHANLAFAYLLQGDFEKSISNAEKACEDRKVAKYAQSLLSESKDLQERFSLKR